MAKVSLKNVSKIYPREKGGEINAVKDLNLEIADREFVVLAGSPSCGKSTALRMIAGLEEISKGDIYIAEGIEGHRVSKFVFKGLSSSASQ